MGIFKRIDDYLFSEPTPQFSVAAVFMILAFFIAGAVLFTSDDSRDSSRQLVRQLRLSIMPQIQQMETLCAASGGYPQLDSSVGPTARVQFICSWEVEAEGDSR